MASMRRFFLASAAGALTSIVLAVSVSCGGEEERPPLGTPDASFSDAPLIGDDTGEPQPDPEPSPGNVCGVREGLQEGATWPLRGGCTTRAGYSTQNGPSSGQVSATFAALASDSSPALSSASDVWFGTTDGWVLAVTVNGFVRWGLKTGGPIKSSAAIDVLGNAVIGSTDGFLYRIAAEDGPFDPDAGAGEDAGPSYPSPRVLFKLALGPIASSPVIGADGSIYVGTTDGKLHSVKGDGSSSNWSVTTNDTLGSSPALGQDGTIYVGSSDQKLYAFSAAGEPKWALDLGSPVTGSPAVGGHGAIYVGTGDGKLHSISAAGAETWAYATGGAITGTPAVFAGSVYVGSEDKKLHAVSTMKGTEKWTYATNGAVGTPVIDAAGTVYVGATDTKFYAITPKGSLFYAVSVKGNVRTAAAIGSGPAIYVTTDTGLAVVGP
jgi:outer membrane protein assembly factor BamB